MKSLQELRKDYKKMVAQRDAAREENERLKAQMQDVDSRFGDYAYLKGFLSPADADRLREQTQAAKDEVTAATGYVVKLEATIKQHEANIRFLNDQSGGVLTTIESLRSQVALLTSEVETWKRVAEVNFALAEKAANAADTAKSEFDKLSSSMKTEVMKSLRKRLHTKTEKINELEGALLDANKLINKLLRVPAVQDAIHEAKARAEAANASPVPDSGTGTAPTGPTVNVKVAERVLPDGTHEVDYVRAPNPDNANGAGDQPSFPAPVQP